MYIIQESPDGSQFDLWCMGCVDRCDGGGVVIHSWSKCVHTNDIARVTAYHTATVHQEDPEQIRDTSDPF